MRNKIILLFLAAAAGGCTLKTKNEIEVKPMHITIDVNLKIQEELKEKFSETDSKAKNISDREAEEALRRYLDSQSGQAK